MSKKEDENQKYYIYMIELRLENPLQNDEPYFYIGKTKDIVSRLINHILRNKNTTKLIKDNGKNIARVIAIRKIYEIIDEEIKELYKQKDYNSIDSITSKIENQFVFKKIVGNNGDKIEENKKRFRGGHYTPKWDSSSDSYKIKKLNTYKHWKIKSILKKPYKIEKDKNIKELKKDIQILVRREAEGKQEPVRP